MSHSPRFICIGSVLWDVIANASVRMADGSDVAGLIRRRPGGVALNIAAELVRIGAEVELMSAVGRDADGDALIAALPQLGCDLIYRSKDPTDTYMALENPDGSVFGAIADCASLEKAGTRIVQSLKDQAPHAEAIILDGNLPVSVLKHIFEENLTGNTKTVLVPASPGKAERLRGVFGTRGTTLYVNKLEANLILETAFESAEHAAQTLHQRGACAAVVTDGARTVAFADHTGVFACTPPKVDAVSTTGAGDVFLATHLVAELAGSDPHHALNSACHAARIHITKDVK